MTIVLILLQRVFANLSLAGIIKRRNHDNLPQAGLPHMFTYKFTGLQYILLLTTKNKQDQYIITHCHVRPNECKPRISN